MSEVYKQITRDLTAVEYNCTSSSTNACYIRGTAGIKSPSMSAKQRPQPVVKESILKLMHNLITLKSNGN